ncbi:MAG: type II secretion system F family protein [Lachnospiraceae bacterium]|nr:type II secretion system F family protein [Lachnospiraceae bacterium]
MMGIRIEALDNSLFCGQLSKILDAGVGYLNAFKILHGQIENRPLKAAAEAVISSLEAGDGITEAMENSGYFDPCLIACVKKADEKNRLSDCLNDFMLIYKNEDRRRRLIGRGVYFPLFITALVVLFVFVMMAVLYPRFIGMFDGIDVEMPPLTVWMYEVSRFLENNMIVILLSFFALMVILNIYRNSGTGRLRLSKYLFTNSPFRKIQKRVVYSSFSENMAELLKYDYKRAEALRILADLYKRDYYFAAILESAADECEESNLLLSTALEESGFFSEMYLELVSLGEEMGNLIECLNNNHELNLEEAERLALKKMNTREPVVFFVTAFVLITVIISLVQPLLRLFEAVSRI